jgi:hypothetical protein
MMEPIMRFEAKVQSVEKQTEEAHIALVTVFAALAVVATSLITLI